MCRLHSIAPCTEAHLPQQFFDITIACQELIKPPLEIEVQAIAAPKNRETAQVGAPPKREGRRSEPRAMQTYGLCAVPWPLQGSVRCIPAAIQNDRGKLYVFYKHFLTNHYLQDIDINAQDVFHVIYCLCFEHMYIYKHGNVSL